MVEESLSLKQVYHYLAARADLYPYGIPERYLQVERGLDQVGSEDSDQERIYSFARGPLLPSRVAIIGAEHHASLDGEKPFSNQIWSLVERIISGGLQLSPHEVFVANTAVVFDQVGGASCSEDIPNRRDLLVGELTGAGNPAVLVCGEVAATVFSGRSSSEFRRGFVSSDGSLHVMVTHALTDIANSQQLKREFWSDLQQLIGRLELKQ